MDHSRVTEYIDKLNMDRIWVPESKQELFQFLQKVWTYRNEMDSGNIILPGYSPDDYYEGWYERNIFEIYREMDKKDSIALADDFINHHHILEKYGIYVFYYYDGKTGFTLYLFFENCGYMKSEASPRFRRIKG